MTRKNSDETINDSLHFFYDASNKPAVVDFNGTKYAYVHDLQGDICQIVDANGTVVVEYTYDAWGKVLNVGFDLIVIGKTVAEVVRTNADADGWQVSVGIGLGINWVHEGNAYTVICLIKEKGIGIPEEMRKWVDKKPEHGIMEF